MIQLLVDHYVSVEVFLNTSLPQILQMCGESRCPQTWDARTKSQQKQAILAVDTKYSAEVLTKAENLLKGDGNILKVLTAEDKAAGSMTYYINSSKFLTQDGFKEVTLTRVKQFLRPVKNVNISRSFHDVKCECISLHKVLAYPCEPVKGGYVFICSCLRFQANGCICSHTIALLELFEVICVRALLTKLVVRKGGGRPLLREATLKQQFELMGKVSFDLGPEKYFKCTIIRF